MESYTPKFSFKQIVNEAWMPEENGYSPIHIDRMLAITAASMWKEIGKVAPEKWYTRLSLELKKFVQANRRTLNSLQPEAVVDFIEKEWCAPKHVTSKRALLSSSPLIGEYDGDLVVLNPEVADNFRRNVYLPGEERVAPEDFRESKQAIEKREEMERIIREREIFYRERMAEIDAALKGDLSE